MGYKVKISEVIDFSNDLKTTTADFMSSLNHVEKSIGGLDAMRSFSGKTAKEAKNYFNDLHKTLLKSFEHIFTDLDEDLKKHLDLFEYSVDSSQFAIIESDYLMDTEKDVNDDYDLLSEEQEFIRETIASVSDISSANHPSTMWLSRDHKSAIKVITDLDRSLDSYTSVGRQDILDIEELLHHIEKAINNAGAISGDSRFTDYKGSSNTVGLPVLKAYNATIHEAVVNEARESKDSEIKDMNESSQEILEKAFTDLKNGEIDETEYYEHLSELRKLQNEEGSDEAVSENFIKYVMDNFDGVTDEFGGNTIAEYLNNNFENVGNNTLKRAELVKAMSGNKPSSTYNYLKDKGKNILKIGRAVSGSLAALTIGVGTYLDYKNTDKTVGEAFSKNAAAGGVGLLMTAGVSVLIKGIATAAVVANPVGWALVGGLAVGTAVTWGFNFAYDNNLLRIQDGLDWTGQKIDKAGQQINKGWNWVGDKVNDGLNKVGEALSSGLDAINPFS